MRSIEEIRNSGKLVIDHLCVDGGMGFIKIGRWKGSVIWSYGGGWEHVSVCPLKKRITPSWNDMCQLKDIFFSEDECVVQYHPPKSEYVNMVPNCLHLWKPLEESLPLPPSIMVGVKKGQSLESIYVEIDKLKKFENRKFNDYEA